MVTSFLVTIASSPGNWLRADNGEVLHISRALEGVSDIVDITQDLEDGSFWVLGADGTTDANHSIYRVNADLDAVIATVPNPHAPGSIATSDLTTHRGIAYLPLFGRLLVLSSVGPRLDQKLMLKEIERDGTENILGEFELTLAEDGKVHGLAYDVLTRNLWTYDTQNDRLIEFNRAGVVVQELTMPGKTSPAVRLLGSGVAYDVQNSGVLYVPHGDIFQAGPSKIFELSVTGETIDDTVFAPRTGNEIPLTNIGDSDLRGLVAYPGPFNQQRLAVVGSGGLIYEVLREISDPAPPTELECYLTLANQVELRWKNHGSGEGGAYEGNIQVVRNGVALTTIQGNRSGFRDPSPIDGPSTYSVRGTEASGGPFSDHSCDCQVTVGSGGLIDWTPFPGDGVMDLAENPETGEVFATDVISSTIHKFDADLNIVASFPSPIDNPSGITYVPSMPLGFPPEIYENLLAISESSGSRVRIVSVDSPDATITTLNLRFNEIESPSIGGLTYSDSERRFYVTEMSTRQVYGFETSGSLRSACSPIFVKASMGFGVTFDPIQDSFLQGFEDGFVREIFAQGNCASSGFDFSLSALGPAYSESGFLRGMQISGNSLLIASSDTEAIYRVLIFPFSRPFVRGDFDGNESVNITDAFLAADYLFGNGDAPNCPDACDSNDDGILDIADPIATLFALFVPDTPPLPAPFPDPGEDPTFRDSLGGCVQ